MPTRCMPAVDLPMRARSTAPWPMTLNWIPQAKSALLVAAASCDLRTRRLSKEEVESLPDSQDESGARRTYLAVELARNKDDSGTVQSLITQMEQRFPQSPWLAEALYTSANMYLLRKDYPQAITYYGDLATRFPTHRYAPSSHWKAAWLNYRLGNYSAAAELFDKQIALYAGGKEIPAALYWRGRLYADQEHQAGMAAAYYETVSRVFEHYYYAQLSRDRLAELGSVTPADVAMLSNIQREEIPALTDDVPEDDEHVIKARLLANAGLNEYIPAEIQAADGSEQWGAFAEAEIYSSDGETFRAMRVLKRALPFYTSAPIDTIPMGYWKILFPQQYWSSIERASLEERVGSVYGGFAHPPGVGVQPLGPSVPPTLGVSCNCCPLLAVPWPGKRAFVISTRSSCSIRRPISALARATSSRHWISSTARLRTPLLLTTQATAG